MDYSTKSINQSLNLYSIFGYLLPGFFLSSLIIVDYDFTKAVRFYRLNHKLNFTQLEDLDLKINSVVSFFSTGTMTDFKFIPFLIFLFFCYLLGHLVSAFSSFFLERFLVKNLMGYPSKILLSETNPKWKFLFGNYRRPLKKEMISQLKILVDKTFAYQVHKDDYYWLCYSYIITCKPYLSPRVHHFVNLYGFSRNITGALFIYLLVRLLILGWFLGSMMDYFSWLTWWLFFIAATFMFWNYLKLFKRQAIDIYFLFFSVNNIGNNEIVEMKSE